MTDLLPLFLNVAGRRVVLFGGGRVAAAKLQQLLAVRAHVTVVSPRIDDQITLDEARALESGVPVTVVQRPFEPSDLDDAWLAGAAATPEVNRAVACAAEARHGLGNAGGQPANAAAVLSGVRRRGRVHNASSTRG